ncbi:D-serine ammonia-lyase [Clostridium sp. D2Q-14]|uniref:D-serine ammonia-lyase n=1 Tax=Anaeromonas gelatinilytica TaxID=2683194 RepID=UPI00193B747B|nr:D-serine ammonia-lyase [Anaeromonas gelatinilytica]MBS4536466.1 D-serine ammonia-lyase [Anaeromonas gelatinilytica]
MATNGINMENESLMSQLKRYNEVFWINNSLQPFQMLKDELPIAEEKISDAEKRLTRFSKYFIQEFSETRSNGGIIDSELTFIPNMQSHMEDRYNSKINGKLFIKQDNNLAVAGSIKARGGIYEVLKYAEHLALENGLITKDSDYSELSLQKSKDFFSQYTIQVGSTGNLGLSIGIMSAKIGFKVIVHMSNDAKQWKKDLLRSKGVKVIEYDSDYSFAVENGRKLSENDPKSHFVDDENSEDLFLGYSVAANRLKVQLERQNININQETPLIVYLPCGVGGGPGGIAYGLKITFGDNVHMFFAEPTHSPCMLLGLATKLHDKISVKDIGLDNKTIADGLAVGKPSSFVGKTVEPIISGIYTIEDEKLFNFLRDIKDTENIKLEPSACAGFSGPLFLSSNKAAKEYISLHDLEKYIDNAIQIVWATGGKLIPEKDYISYYNMKK